MRTLSATGASAIQVDRRKLLEALNRIKLVTPNTTCKPVLQGVRLEASNGILQLGATDLDVALTTQVDTEGDLPPCLIPCQELIKRL